MIEFYKICYKRYTQPKNENQKRSPKRMCLFQPIENKKKLKKIYSDGEDDWVIYAYTTEERFTYYKNPYTDSPTEDKEKTTNEESNETDKVVSDKVEMMPAPEGEPNRKEMKLIPMAYGNKKDIVTLYKFWKDKINFTSKKEKLCLMHCKDSILPWVLWIAGIVAVTGIAYMALTQFKDAPDEIPEGPIIEGDIPSMSEEEILDALSKKQERGQFLMEAEPAVIAAPGSNEIKLVVSNSVQNRSDCFIQIKSMNGEILYTSPKLRPRTYIDKAKLSRPLEEDEQKVKAVYNIYNEQQFRSKEDGKIYNSCDSLVKKVKGIEEPELYTPGTELNGKTVNTIEEYLEAYDVNPSDYEFLPLKVKAVYDVDLTVRWTSQGASADNEFSSTNYADGEVVE